MVIGVVEIRQFERFDSVKILVRLAIASCFVGILLGEDFAGCRRR